MGFGERIQLIEAEENSSQTLTILRKLAGYFSALFSMFLSTTGSACAQGLGGVVPGFQRNIWRFLAQFLSVLPLILLQRKDVRIPRNVIPYMLLTCLAYSVVNWTYYSADTYLPTSTIGATFGASILVLNVLIAGVVFRDIEWFMVVSSGVCVLGVILTTQPHFIFTNAKPVIIHSLCGLDNKSVGNIEELGTADDQWNHTVKTTIETWILNTTSNDTLSVMLPLDGHIGNLKLGYTLCIVAGVSHVVTIYLIKQISNDVHPYVITFWTAVSGIAFALIGMAIFETPMLPSGAVCLGLLMGHAITAGSCFLFITVSVAVLPARIVALVTCFEVVLMCMAQYTVLKDINSGHHNLIEITGVVLVVSGNIVQPIHDVWKENKQTTQTDN